MRQTVRTTSVETVHRGGWRRMSDRGAKERGLARSKKTVNAAMRPQLRRYHTVAAVHIEERGGSASVKGCTAKDRWGERHEEEDGCGGEEGESEVARETWRIAEVFSVFT